MRELQNGILPDRTEATKDAVTYITTDLHLDGEINPLNFVEMSGEFFLEPLKILMNGVILLMLMDI